MNASCVRTGPSAALPVVGFSDVGLVPQTVHLGEFLPGNEDYKRGTLVIQNGTQRRVTGACCQARDRNVAARLEYGEGSNTSTCPSTWRHIGQSRPAGSVAARAAPPGVHGRMQDVLSTTATPSGVHPSLLRRIMKTLSLPVRAHQPAAAHTTPRQIPPAPSPDKG